MPGIRRREFITFLGGAAAVWPLAAHRRARAVGRKRSRDEDLLAQVAGTLRRSRPGANFWVW